MSNIKPYENYNPNYPIPGVNQSSQGFRDNFLQIQKNFIITKNELENIQSKTIQLSNQALGSIVWSNESILNLSVVLADNLEFSGNKGIVVCSGTTAEREEKNGLIRFNTSTGRLETFEGTEWFNLTGKNEYLKLTGGNISGSLSVNQFSSPVISTQSLSVESIHSLRQSVYSFGRIGLTNGTWNSIASWDIDNLTTSGKNCSYSIIANVCHSDLSREWTVCFTGNQSWNFNLANVLSISNPITTSSVSGSGIPVIQMRTIEIGNKLELQIVASETSSLTWEVTGRLNVFYGNNGDLPLEVFVI